MSDKHGIQSRKFVMIEKGGQEWKNLISEAISQSPTFLGYRKRALRIQSPFVHSVIYQVTPCLEGGNMLSIRGEKCK